MTTIRLNQKTYEMKLGYAQLRKLEDENPGVGFEELLGKSLENPSFSTVEKMLFLMIQNPDFSESDLTAILDESFESGENTFVDIMEKVAETVEMSVFFQGMTAKAENTAKKTASKKELAKNKSI